HALGFLFNFLGANLRHSHVWLRFGAWERWFISPAQHQLHHGRTRAMTSSNYGTWLACCDRWAGSWRPAPERPMRDVGLEHANHRPDRVGSLLLGPLVEFARLLTRRRKLAGATLALVVGAGSTPAKAAPAQPDEAAPSGEATPPGATTPPAAPDATSPGGATPPAAPDATHPGGAPPPAPPAAPPPAAATPPAATSPGGTPPGGTPPGGTPPGGTPPGGTPPGGTPPGGTPPGGTPPGGTPSG